jgi:hypothetical protein
MSWAHNVVELWVFWLSQEYGGNPKNYSRLGALSPEHVSQPYQY